MNEALEKDKILLSLVDRLKTSEAQLNAQAKAHKAKVEGLKKELAEMNENFEVAKAKKEISELETTKVQKNIEELRDSREKCYEISIDCAKVLKDSFAKVGSYSSEQKFIRGDPEGVIQWIGKEVKAFEEILSDRGDFCAFADARGVAVVLEKTGFEHVKAAALAEAVFTVDDTKEHSTEATLMGRKFYSNVWMKGNREMAEESIKKSEKESHDARVEAKEAEEAAERALIICILLKTFLSRCLFIASKFIVMFYITASLSPPPEPYDPEVDPIMKEALDVMKIANEVVEEVVDKHLHEAAERILKED
jgi:hypothetical protein